MEDASGQTLERRAALTPQEARQRLRVIAAASRPTAIVRRGIRHRPIASIVAGLIAGWSAGKPTAARVPVVRGVILPQLLRAVVMGALRRR